MNTCRGDMLLALQRLSRADCGDNSCLFGGKGKGGMRTNGGCRCYSDLADDICNREQALNDRIDRAKDALTIIKKFDDGICGFGIDIGRAIKILEGKDGK